MGAIDPTTGIYIYSADEAIIAVPVTDVLNRLANSVRTALLADRARLTTLEQQVGGGYGAMKLSAAVDLGAAAATVPFNQTELAAGVSRTGNNLYAQTAGVYLASLSFSATPAAAGVFRNVWLERLISGAWTTIPLTPTQCALGPGGTLQIATLSVPVALGAGDGVRMRSAGSTAGTGIVTLNPDACFVSLVKVSA